MLGAERARAVVREVGVELASIGPRSNAISGAAGSAYRGKKVHAEGMYELRLRMTGKAVINLGGASGRGESGAGMPSASNHCA